MGHPPNLLAMFCFADSLTGLRHNRKTSCRPPQLGFRIATVGDTIADIVWPWSVGYFAGGLRAILSNPFLPS
jgi:hypothetical protein